METAASLINEDTVTIDFIFVYGTLRKNTATDMHRVLARYCDYVSEGCIQGKLYEVNDYPGAVESEDNNDRVHGELYKISSAGPVLSLLDAYEECTDMCPKPHEYMRKKCAVSLSCGGTVLAWVYVFNHDVSNLLRIESGEYLHYRKPPGQPVNV